jgi:hypothetical protein
LRIAKRLLVSNVQQACRDAEKKKPENRAVDELIMNLPEGQLVISQLRLMSLTLPLSLGNVYPPSQLCWCTENGRLSASGLWTFTSNNDSKPVKYNGNIYVPPTLYSAHVNSTLGRTPENQPAITTVDCRIQLNVTKMFFSSATPQGSAFISKLEPNITLVAKEGLEDYVCEVISTALRLALNTILITFKTKIVLWESPKILLDYSLISDPYVDPDDSSINGKLKGLITVNGAAAPPFYPHDFAALNDSMLPLVSAVFSDFVLNSLLHSSYNARMLQMTATSDFSKKVAHLLRLKCDEDEICVGTSFPSCANLPANSSAELSAMATQAPTAIFLESAGYMQITGSLNLDARMVDNRIQRCFTSPFSLVALLMPSAVVQKTQTMVSMEARIIDLRLMAAIPSLPADASIMRDRVVGLFIAILEEMVNKPLQLGIPAPSFNSTRLIKFTDPRVTFYNRTLLLHQRR